jgi:N-acetylglucosamine transport system substrate-binding protein
MKGVHKFGLMILAGLTLSGAGCTGGGGSTTGGNTTGTGTTGATTGTTNGAKVDTGESINIAVFQGGYGIDFFQKSANEWMDKTGTAANLEGNPRIWDQLRPQFVSGDVPDITWPGWGMDYWGLVYDDQLMDLNEALDSPPYGQTEGKWRDAFDPGLLKLGQYEGKQYMLPFHININGWWYNKKVFDANGWTPPKTFDELLALNDKIKAKGLAPITYQGKYPYYMLYGFIYAWTVSDGGESAWKACQNMEEGAWKSPSVLKAAQMVETLRKRGDFMKGSAGLDHTTSQLEFLKGKAVMIPCGTWLYSEMENVMPKGTQIEFMLPPTVAGGQGDPGAVLVATEPFVVPAKAKNPVGGIDYYKYITTPEKAKEFVEAKGTLMGIKVADGAKYPPHLVTPAKLFGEAKYKWNAEFRTWYKDFASKAESLMSKLLDGRITPQEFCDQMEGLAKALRNDASIIKHKVE